MVTCVTEVAGLLVSKKKLLSSESTGRVSKPLLP